MTNEGIAVIKVRDVLMVVIPPEPDDETVSNLQNQILRAIEKNEASGLVLDISTVEVLDSYFARMVSETTKMVALMGARTVIAGMRPSVAIATIELGLTLGNTLTALSVDRAFDILHNASNGMKPR